eukprot:12427285-Karenia_brevis.AAC.1
MSTHHALPKALIDRAAKNNISLPTKQQRTAEKYFAVDNQEDERMDHAAQKLQAFQQAAKELQDDDAVVSSGTQR